MVAGSKNLTVVLTLLAGLATLLAAFAVAVPSADAARRPTRAEATVIKRLSLRGCGNVPEPCRYHGARVSTRNARYAWGDVTGEGFSGVLLKRRSPRSHRFRVIGTQGGGVGDCREWRKLAPRAVLRDLRVSGLLDASTGRAGSCG